MEAFRQDLHYAVRVLRKSPGLTLTAVVSLALGIGCNTAVFSLVHAALLRSLPYPEPDRLVRVAQRATQDAVSIPEFEFWKAHAQAFDSAAGYRGVMDRSLASDGRHEWIRVLAVTSDFFGTLGIRPALGREFSAEETRHGGPQAIIVSDGLWRRAFGGDAGVLGRAVRLGEANYTVVGVLPRGFWFPQAADAFVPLQPAGDSGDRGRNTEMIARLKPGLDLRQAEARMAAVTRSFREGNGDVPDNYAGLTLIPYHAWLTGDIRLNLLLLFGAVALLLLIACSNVAGMLLARLAGRQKEIAVRRALGSTPRRLFGHFLIENILLTTLGGIAGLLCAAWFLDGLVALIPFELPAPAPVRLEWPVLIFALAIAFGTALAFSTAAFLGSSRLKLHESLKTAGPFTDGGSTRQSARSFLVVAEVALSATLLVSATLLIQSLHCMYREQLGFTPHGLVTFRTPPPSRWYRNGDERAGFETRLLHRFQAVPGVRAVAAVNVLPLDGQNNFPAERAGHPGQDGGIEVRLVTPAYFEAMRIPVRRGRFFSGRDTATAQPVIVVNETLARRWWAQGNPLGDRVVVGRFMGQDLAEIKERPREVVGVVADTKTVYLKEPPRPTVYLPAAQASWYTRRHELGSAG